MLNIIKVVLTIVFLLDKLCIVILSFLSVLFKDSELLIKRIIDKAIMLIKSLDIDI